MRSFLKVCHTARDETSDEWRILRAARSAGMYPRGLIDLIREFLKGGSVREIAARASVSKTTANRIVTVAASIGIHRQCGCGKAWHEGFCGARTAMFMPARKAEQRADRVAQRLADKPPYLAAIEKATADIWDSDVRNEVRQALALAFLSSEIDEEDFRASGEAIRRRVVNDKLRNVSLDSPIPGTNNLSLMDRLSNEDQSTAYDGGEWSRRPMSARMRATS
jgi:hypothetical protein